MPSQSLSTKEVSTTGGAIIKNPVLWLVIVGIASFMAAIAAEMARDWLPAVDGPYQTINACRRVMDGQIPGRDFAVFHGIGTIWYHSGFYALMGGELAGSVASYLAACFAIVWIPSTLAARISGYSKGLSIGLGLLMVNVLLVTPGPLYDVVYPGGNMLGTRIGLTLAMVMLTAFLWQRFASHWWQALALGTAAAAGFWISQEQGMSVSASLGVLGLWLLWTRRLSLRKFGLLFCIIIVSFIVMYFSGLTLLSGGGLSRVLDYSWKQIPENQFWFFGQPPKCIISIRDIFDWKEIIKPAIFAIIPWLGAYGVSFFNRKKPTEIEKALTVFLMAYALLSLHPLAGYKSPHYFASMGHAGFVVFLLKSRGFWEWAKLRLGEKRLVYGLLAVGCMCFGLELVKNKVRSIFGKDFVQAKAVVFKSDESAFAGMSPDAKEAERIQRFAQSIGPHGRLWSTFAGPEDEALGSFLPSRYDYIIYALTEEAESEYLAAFNRFDPTHVITGRESTGGIFQWMAKRYWNFHREVLRSYEPVAAMHGRVLWRKRSDAPEQLAEQSLPFSSERLNAQQWTIGFSTLESPQEVGVYELRLTYRLSEDPLPLLSRRLTRIAAQAEQVPDWKPTAIRVKQSDVTCEFRFPVIRKGQSEPVKINLQSLSPFGAPNLVLEKVELLRLSGFTDTSALVLQNDSFVTPEE